MSHSSRERTFSASDADSIETHAQLATHLCSYIKKWIEYGHGSVVCISSMGSITTALCLDLLGSASFGFRLVGDRRILLLSCYLRFSIALRRHSLGSIPRLKAGQAS